MRDGMAPPRIARERFVIRGDLDSPLFPPWIERFSNRLGLEGGVSLAGPGSIEVVVSGPPDLVDALELVCSLGIIEVMVESIERESLEPLL